MMCTSEGNFVQVAPKTEIGKTKRSSIHGHLVSDMLKSGAPSVSLPENVIPSADAARHFPEQSTPRGSFA
jgi:hypothetical protein